MASQRFSCGRFFACIVLVFCTDSVLCVGSSCGKKSDDSTVAGPLVPSRVDISAAGNPWQDAMGRLQNAGAVILSGLMHDQTTDFEEIARGLPARLFEGAGHPTLLSPDAPVSGVHLELQEAKRQGKYLPGSGLLPHTDGYVYGDYLPDFVFLLCEQPSSRGGANTLIDGKAVLEALDAGNPGQRGLSMWLANHAVDLAEHNDTGITAGREASGPVAQWKRMDDGSKRLKWRRQLNVHEVQKHESWTPLSATDAVDSCAGTPSKQYISLWRPLPSDGAEQAKNTVARLAEFDAVLQRATLAAARSSSFSLKRGEALVIDNYRVLHARAPYVPGGEDAEQTTSSDVDAELERRMWRVWAWSSDSSGIPPDGVKSSQPLNASVFAENKTDDSCPGGSCKKQEL